MTIIYPWSGDWRCGACAVGTAGVGGRDGRVEWLGCGEHSIGVNTPTRVSFSLAPERDPSRIQVARPRRLSFASVALCVSVGAISDTLGAVANVCSFIHSDIAQPSVYCQVYKVRDRSAATAAQTGGSIQRLPQVRPPLTASVSLSGAAALTGQVYGVLMLFPG